MNKIESPEESRKALDKIVSDLTRSITKKDELSRFWFFILIMFVGVGLWGWGIQIKNGLGVTGMNDYVSWGLYLDKFPQLARLQERPRNDQEKLIAERLLSSDFYQLRPGTIRLIDNSRGFGFKQELRLPE